MASDTAIKVENVSKAFNLPHEKNTSIKSLVINFYRRNRSYERQQVLKDISFEIKEGEFFGIVGRNGSGKSTLLKLLAGIYTPDEGTVTVHGNLTPFIELGVGFNPELTGRENIFLNGALLGFNRKEMAAMYDDIVEFAELGRFMDQKLKNYSSGMQVRLAFSIAVRARTAILLIDEVLAVGDVKFQQKCFDYFYRLKREKRTIVFISHDMDSIQKFCDRALVIHDGDIKHIGTPTEAAIIYKKYNFAIPVNDSTLDENNPLKVTLLNADRKPQQTFTTGDTMVAKVDWPLNPTVQFMGVAIHRDDGVYIFGPNNISKKRAIPETATSAEYEVELNIGTGSYYLEIALFGRNDNEKIYYVAEGPPFAIHNTDTWQGLTELKHRWLVH